MATIEDDGPMAGQVNLFLEELAVEPLETQLASATAGSVFTGGSFSTAGSCGSSLSSTSSFSSAG